MINSAVSSSSENNSQSNQPKLRSQVKFHPGQNSVMYFFDSKTIDPEVDDVFWIVKWINKKLFAGDKCNYLIRRIEERKSRGLVNPKVLVVDRGDSSSFHKTGCPERISALIGRQNHYLAVRNLVQNRNYGCLSMTQPTCFDDNKPFRDLYGEPWDYSQLPFAKHIRNGCIAKVDFPVRESLQSRIQDRLDQLKASTLSDIQTKDVGHFWKIERNDKYGQLRNRVTEAIQDLIENSDITGTAGLVSNRGKVGRISVADKYVDGLIGHKIIVVAQRDHWEGHLRLMEALISGALVMTDPVMHLPAGYTNGVNIVVYDSLADLKEKIKYYLSPEGSVLRKKIAQQGKQLALEHHKPEDMYRRLIFGHWPRNWSSPVINLI
ncbi:unnamed protein product [Cylindrotheca closterium]|uniref:Spore protein YkvP/CgeB glycosyl transferase-like domain-containing protein n=1 Tax=Cylindrotheca closterium TaxID=2856 RepID=A0AAD2CLB4_9STRA|nr:unnamed protein product [Cylindrotheca closterium]